ncbi:TPA: hypothetical protein DDZ86_02035 [Candidatus Dependentiae bacterium]|nr:MAG: hypothetical protein UW09_C0001G0232 [candidate division TM6 bacterium GW2011_GWF2_43_87]HBL98403.1 hypothetical protein [Candidatus Dependentiae bacterium]
MKSRVVLCLFGALCFAGVAPAFVDPYPRIETKSDVATLFFKSPEEINRRIESAVATLKAGLDYIVNQPAGSRTFDSTIRMEDRLSGFASLLAALLELTVMTHPDKVMRDAASQGYLKFSVFLVNEWGLNRSLYKAFCDYDRGLSAGSNEYLTCEQKCYLEHSLRSFELNGLGLPDDKLQELKVLCEKISEVGLQFQTNINNARAVVAVAPKDFAGVDDKLLDGLVCDDAGRYLLEVTASTYHAVLENCRVSKTREAVWAAFRSRAYPENQDVLKQLIALRGQLAALLGFASCAHLDLVNEMAKTPKRVIAFLDDMRAKSLKKYEREWTLWTENIPEGVELTSSGELHQWDVPYVKEAYKKRCLSLDEQALKFYFPVQHTVDALLSIYEQFLGIEFRQEPVQGLWHEDVRYIAAYARDGTLLGHIFLDLFPREGKFSHACEMSILPAVSSHAEGRYPAVIVIVANFPKPTLTQPALLPFESVRTFFHEFGHAMHALLGATDLVSFSGTATSRDFVETPSQMFEEWLYDPIVLKRISCHYQTGEALDDATIKLLCALRSFETGFFVRGQSGAARFALDCFSGVQLRDGKLPLLRDQIDYPGIGSDERDHSECSFGHLAVYGARYYSYLWSQVFAVDLFCCIKEQDGLLNESVGKRFAAQVLGQGGSRDPNEFMQEFLGREPRSDAFFRMFD